MLETAATPDIMEVIVAKDGIDFPEPEMPYYILAKEHLYLHKKTAIGTVLMPESKLPFTVGSIGEHKQGVFNWTGEKVPAQIIGQATAFFRRIYEKHHTEAEVLLTMHNDTKAFRIFIPHQRVSAGGVKSVHEPTHIGHDYLVVGTIHSHCMMSAFHSGTDTNDASDMDGVHFTIGKVMDNTPEIVAMVSMNGKNFHYAKPSDIAEINFNGHTAPEWWDEYVFPASSPAAKPKSLTSITDEMWDEFRGIVTMKPHVSTWANGSRAHQPWVPQVHRVSGPRPQSLPHYAGDWGWDAELGMYGPRILDESREFNKTHQQQPSKSERKRLAKLAKKAAWQASQWNRARATQAVWERDGTLLPSINDTDESRKIDMALDTAMENNFFIDEDWKTISASDVDEIIFWQKFFSDRMSMVADVLDTLDMAVEYSIKPKKIMKQLPGQTTMEAMITEGAKA